VTARPGGGDRIADWADSGVVPLTGRADGPPLVPAGFAATAARDAERAFRLLLTDLDSSEVPAGWHRLLGERAALTGASRRGPWSVGGTCRAVATADGWVAVNLARDTDIAAVPALVEGDVEAGPEGAWQAVDAWATVHSGAEVVAQATLLGLPCGLVPPVVDEPGAAAEQTRRVPIATVELGRGARPPAGSRPLVVDLSALWAGPLCAHLLGTAGAQVVKVEAANRLDGARRGQPEFYDLLNAGHDSVVVNLSAAEDRHLLQHLLDLADVVVTASRPRAWVSLGVDPYDVCGRSPTTWVAVTAYGLAEGDRVGFGDDVAMAGGLVAREPDQPRPLPAGDAIADPLTGMSAAVAALASYRAGGSRLLDVSMRDVVGSTVACGGPVDDPPAQLRMPVARRSGGAAASPGRDTERWRHR
jgi:hypothetical protein